MGYNWATKKMKKRRLLIIAIVAVCVTLTSFTVAAWYDCKRCNGTGFWATRDCQSCRGKGTITEIVNCPRCDGKGYIRDRYGDQQTCPNCDGSKKILNEKTCPTCNGSREEKMRCPNCDGTGKVWIDD
jgi:DnaJ-class molecular chaperone